MSMNPGATTKPSASTITSPVRGDSEMAAILPPRMPTFLRASRFVSGSITRPCEITISNDCDRTGTVRTQAKRIGPNRMCLGIQNQVVAWLDLQRGRELKNDPTAAHWRCMRETQITTSCRSCRAPAAGDFDFLNPQEAFHHS